MRKLSFLLVLVMLLMTCAGCGTEPANGSTGTRPNTTAQTTRPSTTVPPTTAPEVDYANSTVILYTANVRGDVGLYSAIAAARAAYEAMGAEVFLVDAGNYLQGTAYANGDMGLSVYGLMEAAGYDVAGMGVLELAYGNAEVGYADHGDLVKYYTQAELYRGTPQLQYRQNAAWDKTPVMAVRGEKAAADFHVICSNLIRGENATNYYDFEASVVLGEKLRIGFVSTMPDNATDYVDSRLLAGYSYWEIAEPDCDILVSLGGGSGDIVIEAPVDGGLRVGAWVIDRQTRRITTETVDLTGKDEHVDRLIASIQVPEVIGTNQQILNGSVAANCNGQTGLGLLAADALKWYAQTYMQELEYPVIGLQSGGNCRNFLYNGQITQMDLDRAYHTSTAGIAVIYVTGAQLLEALEAATQQAYCPAWPQVSGIAYTVDLSKVYDAGQAYGHYYQAASIQRVSIATEGFDPAATYAVIADRMLLLGGETYYMFRECQSVVYGEDGLTVSDIVALYIRQELGGTLDYADTRRNA